jgi:phosphinothricin acetyltransferase
MQDQPLTVRDAREEDISTVQKIYAHHVLTGTSSFEEVPPTTDELLSRRKDVLKEDLPYLVAERAGEVVGYSYASLYRARSAYRFTIENSVYVDHRLGRHGIGSSLLAALLRRSELGRWKQMIAVIGDSANTASIALHLKYGFRLVGTFRKVGFKFGRWIDTVLMQRPLGATRSDLAQNR